VSVKKPGADLPLLLNVQTGKPDWDQDERVRRRPRIFTESFDKISDPMVKMEQMMIDSETCGKWTANGVDSG